MFPKSVMPFQESASSIFGLGSPGRSFGAPRACEAKCRDQCRAALSRRSSLVRKGNFSFESSYRDSSQQTLAVVGGEGSRTGNDASKIGKTRKNGSIGLSMCKVPSARVRSAPD